MARAYLAASDNRHPWRCASRGAVATGRLRTRLRFWLPPAIERHELAYGVGSDDARRHIWDDDVKRWPGARWRGKGKTYICYDALAEAGASVEPVIVLELVDFDALSFARRWWCDVCHNRLGRVDSLRLGQKTLRSEARSRESLRRARGRFSGGRGQGRGWGGWGGRVVWCWAWCWRMTGARLGGACRRLACWPLGGRWQRSAGDATGWLDQRFESVRARNSRARFAMTA